MLKRFFFITCLVFTANTSAEVVQSEPAPGAEIRIFSDDQTEIKEFRSHGQVYMIKITPKKGLPYYLVDADGDGDFDTRHNDLTPDLKIPSWVLFSW